MALYMQGEVYNVSLHETNIDWDNFFNEFEKLDLKVLASILIKIVF